MNEVSMFEGGLILCNCETVMQLNLEEGVMNVTRGINILSVRVFIVYTFLPHLKLFVTICVWSDSCQLSVMSFEVTGDASK